ncbi:hypothetical protein FQN49_002085 [Arthroderma sp. PD_2]|nr:hypothetical protein FQN49_002085 [Arthroderma sp. PD_2]
MKFTTVFALVACIAGVATASDSMLEKKACTPSSCVCNGIQGQFCGDENINSACKNGHVYECAQDAGNACDYGLRDSCRQCGKLSC